MQDEDKTPDDDILGQIAEILRQSDKAVALTGAGISVESGIPPFRGKGGLWSRYDPSEYADVDSFLKNPEKVWNMLAELLDILGEAEPNPAHHALAELEYMGILKSVITQNVDSLHQAAGSKKVIELHGNNSTLKCMKCGNSFPARRYLDEMPPRCDCEFVLRPDVVFFGEQLPEKALLSAYELARTCDVMMVIGTSGLVVPAANLPYVALRNGAAVIEVNWEKTPLSNHISKYSILGKAGELLKEVVSIIKERADSF
jgi:NAD-dependent deacetylase